MARERLIYLLTAVFLWVSASYAQNPPSPPPLLAPEPAIVGELCRLTSAGTLEALDLVKMKKQMVSQRGIVQNWRYYLDGEVSSVVFKPGEPQVLALRLLAPADRGGEEVMPQELYTQLICVGRLYVQDGKRFPTNNRVPLEVRSYGNLTLGLDSKKPDRLASWIQLIPRETLPPGEYIVAIMAGTYRGKPFCKIAPGRMYFTFGIAGR